MEGTSVGSLEIPGSGGTLLQPTNVFQLLCHRNFGHKVGVAPETKKGPNLLETFSYVGIVLKSFRFHALATVAQASPHVCCQQLRSPEHAMFGVSQG